MPASPRKTSTPLRLARASSRSPSRAASASFRPRGTGTSAGERAPAMAATLCAGAAKGNRAGKRRPHQAHAEVGRLAEGAGDPQGLEYETRCDLSRQILGPLLGEPALEQSGGLADLDHVAVGVAHVAADLSTAIDRRRHELGA